MTYAAVYEYETQFRSGKKRKGLLLEWNGRIVEASPLEGFSTETFSEAKEALLSLFTDKPNAPLPASVAFALSCLSLPKHPVQHWKNAGLIQSIDDIPQEPSCERYKLKLKTLSLDEAIQFVSTAYKVIKKPLRIDCNQGWTFEKTVSFLSFFNTDVIEYIEEPTPCIDTNTQIARCTPHTVALDESLNKIPKDHLADIASQFVFILKPTVLGPIESFMDMDAKKWVLSSAYESGIGLRWILNYLYEYPCIDPYIGLGTSNYLQSDPAPLYTGETSIWNVQLGSGLTVLHKGQLFTSMESLTHI